MWNRAGAPALASLACHSTDKNGGDDDAVAVTTLVLDAGLVRVKGKGSQYKWNVKGRLRLFQWHGIDQLQLQRQGDYAKADHCLLDAEAITPGPLAESSAWRVARMQAALDKAGVCGPPP
jgi:hypothetical protein